jgi:YebC/PmpR family DNA-binding regulatory protein
MSGHSHFATIKHKKEAEDAKRSKAFSKVSQLLTMAAREGGGDPESNPKLRIVINQAKEANMPSENVERAIKKGTGELAGENLEAISFEAYGPGGIAVIIEGITDNKNRSIAEIKKILNEHGGKIVQEGAVRWMFEQKGIIALDMEGKDKEQIELTAIEAGADDVIPGEEILEIYTKPDELEKVKKALEDKGLIAKSTLLGWVAKEEISLTDAEKESCQKFFESLDECDSVQEIYSNLKL